jgi:beta-phosphoglucomutase-like phosphatase (HAD superfamily)
MTVQALLFDLDGTLADTDPVHLQAWIDCLRPYDVKIDRDYYRSRISGRLSSAVAHDLLPGLNDEDVKAIVQLKQSRFCELGDSLTRLNGLDKLLAWSKRNSLSLGLVTNATRPHASFMLSKLGLEGFFDAEVMGEEVPAGKPDPAPYRMALSNLKILPQQALAFEDSTSGIRAAVAAGVKTVGVASSQTPDRLLGAGAFLVIDDFRDPQLWKLLGSPTEE